MTVIKAHANPPCSQFSQLSAIQVDLLLPGPYGLLSLRFHMLLDDGLVFFKIQAMHCIAAKISQKQV